MTVILDIYIKFNAMLACVYFMWWLGNKIAAAMGVEQSPKSSLVQVRVLLCVILSIPVVVAAFPLLNLELLNLSLAPVVTMLVIGDQTVATSISEGLGQQWVFLDSSVSLVFLLSIFVVIGICVITARVSVKWLSLKTLIENAVVWKRYAGLDILIAENVATPFSTKAMGRNQVVLPYALIRKPRHFRIAIQHEFQHLRNGDLSWVMVMELLRVVCFWNPFVYFWQNDIDCLQEYACDQALTLRGLVTAKDYGNCLLDVASQAQEERQFASSYMVPRFTLWGENESQLKRRVAMLYKSYGSSEEKIKSLVSTVLLSGIVTLVGFTLFGQASLAQENSLEVEGRTQILPTVTVPPKYPRVALDEKLTGWVQVDFTVGEQGNVSGISVIDGCARGPEANTCQTNNVFEASAIEAIAQFKFEPIKGNNEEKAVAGVNYVFRFCLDEEGCSGSFLEGLLLE